MKSGCAEATSHLAPMIDHDRLESIVREAGRIAHALWPGADGNTLEGLKSWDKAPGAPVCEADIAVDAFLKRELQALLPSAGWLSEETKDDSARLATPLLWLVDPIDGTRDFIRGRPGWSVSVALVSQGRPLIGLVEAPARGESWRAVAGQGAFLGGAALAASRRTQLDGARLPAHSVPKIDRLFELVEQPNSIALRICMVADDRADLVATLRWGYEWDIAAACLIAREAGAAATDAFGQTLQYNKRDPRAFGVLVCAPKIHEAALEHLAGRAGTIGAS